MSTTDAIPGVEVQPYEIFLMRPELRRGAWWSTSLQSAMRFDSIEAAEAEWLRHWPADRGGRTDIAPLGHAIPVWQELHHIPRELAPDWSGSPDPDDPDNFWIDDETGERIPA